MNTNLTLDERIMLDKVLTFNFEHKNSGFDSKYASETLNLTEAEYNFALNTICDLNDDLSLSILTYEKLDSGNCVIVSFKDYQYHKFKKEEGFQGLDNENQINDILGNELKNIEQLWEKNIDDKVNKRVDDADFYIDIIISENLLKLEKEVIRKYFKQWFKQTKSFDLKFKNGDLAIEDGDIKIAPDFDKSDIPAFITWFENEKQDFLNYLKKEGVEIPEKGNLKNQTINNHGNLVYNENSDVKNQSIESNTGKKESNWSKASVIISAIVGAAVIAGVGWTIFCS